MIYTIGYARLTPERLEQIVIGLNAVLVDVRYKPFSRKPGFSGKQLAAKFGSNYAYHGDQLGGQHVTAEGIRTIKQLAEKSNLVLMCLEEAPGDCHRHHEICAPHFPDAVHIFQHELVTARELSRADAEDTDYEYADLMI